MRGRGADDLGRRPTRSVRDMGIPRMGARVSMRMGRGLIALVAVVAVGCAARDVHTRFPIAAETPGSLELRFAGAVDELLVTVNGQLVVEDRHTRRVFIAGIPPGSTTVMVASQGAPERAFTIEVPAGENVVVPLAGGAPRGTGLWQSLLGAAITIGYLALRSVL